MITWQTCKACAGEGYVWNSTPPGSRGAFHAATCPDCCGTGGGDFEIDDAQEEDE